MKRRKRKPPVPAWQKRVIAERKELDRKITRLSIVMFGPRAFDVPVAMRRMLQRQLHYMQLYRDVLDERIEAFK